MAPSSLPANRSTPRSQILVPFPPSGPSRQTIRTRGASPGGCTLTRFSTTRRSPNPSPTRPLIPGGIRHSLSFRRPTAPEGPGVPDTPSPFHTLSASVARRRRRNRVRPGPGWCFVRSTPERPLSRSEPFRPRHLRACGRPAVPRGDQRGLGPPRTRLGGFTRLSTLLLRSELESSFLRWFVGPPGSDSPCRVRRDRILEDGGALVNPVGRNPQVLDGFPLHPAGRAQGRPQVRPCGTRNSVPGGRIGESGTVGSGVEDGVEVEAGGDVGHHPKVAVRRCFRRRCCRSLRPRAPVRPGPPGGCSVGPS